MSKTLLELAETAAATVAATSTEDIKNVVRMLSFFDAAKLLAQAWHQAMTPNNHLRTAAHDLLKVHSEYPEGDIPRLYELLEKAADLAEEYLANHPEKQEGA